ncbi:MAG: undecaprenyl-diphosphatase UppP [Armatimonadota bacterium]
MELLNAIWLGILQGITEFLPISSSAHLILMRYWFGWEIADPQAALMFDVALHVGTLMAILLYFWRDLARLASALISNTPERAVDRRLAHGILIGCIPAALAGSLFEEPIEQFFRTQYALISGLLIGIGLLMALVDWRGRKTRSLESIGLLDALLIGVAQALALIPGFSRSGITMIAGLALGLQREAAARFSFLLATPITFGAAVWSFRHVFTQGVPEGMAIPMLAGVLTSMVVGWLSIAFLISYLRTRSLMPFVIYRVGVGVTTLIRIAVVGLR